MSLTVPRWGLSEGSGSTPSALPCQVHRLLPLPLRPGVRLCLLPPLVALGVLTDLWGKQSPQQPWRGVPLLGRMVPRA